MTEETAMSESAYGARAYTLEGRVQGVGFRAFIRHAAQETGISGWARNEPDGTVAVEAAGARDKLRSFEERLREGPPAARVEHVEIRELDAPPDAEGFEIRF